MCDVAGEDNEESLMFNGVTMNSNYQSMINNSLTRIEEPIIVTSERWVRLERYLNAFPMCRRMFAPSVSFALG